MGGPRGGDPISPSRGGSEPPPAAAIGQNTLNTNQSGASGPREGPSGSTGWVALGKATPVDFPSGGDPIAKATVKTTLIVRK